MVLNLTVGLAGATMFFLQYLPGVGVFYGADIQLIYKWTFTFVLVVG